MRASALASSVAVAATLLASTVLADVDPIVIKGSKFFYKTNGTQFFMKGVAYQQDYQGGGNGSTSGTKYIDPLADESGCRRDVPKLAQLSTNTIRVYAIDPSKNHDTCMQLLADAGIYVLLDLSSPAESINRDSPEWTTGLFKRYTDVVDNMNKYNNILGFFAGNEVSNNVTNTNATPFVKAAVRDTKKYIKDKNYRAIGVGYATNDDKDIRADLASYFNCGPAEAAIDFWGYNIYSWCSPSSYDSSGFDDRTDEFSSYSVPVFFAEYGCNKARPRPFDEVPVLYGDQMAPVWSGGVVYMYFEETNEYGLVTLDGNSVEELGDFSSLSSQMATVTPSAITANGYNPSNTAKACPTTGNGWNAATALPPTPDSALCSCMVKSLSCVVVPGLSDNQTQALFGQVCGYVDGKACQGIKHDGATGTYGAYSMCSPSEQLSFAFNQYYVLQRNANSACEFDGNAKLQSSQAASGTCASQISQVGTAGTGMASATGTKKPNAAGMVTAPQMELGLWQMGAYVVCAFAAGIGMVVL